MFAFLSIYPLCGVVQIRKNSFFFFLAFAVCLALAFLLSNFFLPRAILSLRCRRFRRVGEWDNDGRAAKRDKPPLDRFCWAEQKQLTAVASRALLVAFYCSLKHFSIRWTFRWLACLFIFYISSSLNKKMFLLRCVLSDQFYFVAVSDQTVFRELAQALQEALASKV